MVNGKPTPDYKLIVDHLNKVTGKSFKAASSPTRRKIDARWNEGWRTPDFFHVHVVKSTEWTGTKWEKYLRPETLYGSKFEGYRQQQLTRPDLPEKAQSNLAAAKELLRREGLLDEEDGQNSIPLRIEQTGDAV